MDTGNRLDMCWLDLLSGNELLATRLGFCPQIDKETRGILQALMCDMNNLRGTLDPEEQREQWLAALYMTEILEDVLMRTPENTQLPAQVVWLDRHR